MIAGARKLTDRFGNTLAGGDDTYGGAVINMGNAAQTVAAANEIDIPSGDAVASGAAPDGDSLLAALFVAAEQMDSKNVPSEGRYCLLPPANYYQLVKTNKDAINRDYGNDGNGSIAQGNIMSVAGIRILKSNHIPTGAASSTELLANAQIQNDVFGSAGVGYGNTSFAETKGVVFQTEGVGTVKLLDLAMESEYFMERLGTMLMAKYAMGHGVLREEACMELIVTAAG